MSPKPSFVFPFVFVSILSFFHPVTSQAQNSGLCGVEVTEVKASTLLGHLVGYTVKFQNNKQQTIDHLIWSVDFEDNAGVVIDHTSGIFNSTDLIQPIQPGNSKRFVRTPPKVKGASRAKIAITRVHTISGETCEAKDNPSVD